MKNRVSELVLIVVVLLPCAYLLSLYSALPERVPIHWNIQGEVDGWGGKNTTWIISLLPILTYFGLLVAAKIDPKSKLNLEDKKFGILRLILVLFMSMISIFILMMIADKYDLQIANILVIIGLLFVFLGNYLPTLSSNYFVGIRTPWTLQNEEVWRKTHRFTGRVWIMLGLLIAILGGFPDFPYLFVAVITLVVLKVALPLIMSYVYFDRINDD